MSTQTRNLTLAQDGTGIPGAWSDSPSGLGVLQGVISVATGLIFDYACAKAPDGRALDPPITQGLVLTLHITSVFPAPDATLELLAVPETAPANFSDSLIPALRGELLLGAADVHWTGNAYDLAITAGTYLTADHANTPACRQNLDTLRMLYWGSAFWQGRIALSLQTPTTAVGVNFDAKNTAPGAPPRLAATYYPFWQGLIGSGGPRERMVRDGRFGMPALNTELVRDGDQPGLWVRATDSDPYDEPATYRPKPGEGTVDDDVTSV